MTDPTGYISPDDAGRWDGDVFIFDPPLMHPDQDGQPHVIRVVDFSRMHLPDGITRSDVVHALLNPVHVQTIPADGGEPQ